MCSTNIFYHSLILTNYIGFFSKFIQLSFSVALSHSFSLYAKCSPFMLHTPGKWTAWFCCCTCWCSWNRCRSNSTKPLSFSQRSFTCVQQSRSHADSAYSVLCALCLDLPICIPSRALKYECTFFLYFKGRILNTEHFLYRFRWLKCYIYTALLMT